jgi:hypothetical protein
MCARFRDGRLRRSGFEQALSVEANLALVGRIERVITLNAVVLPAPFGPISPTISPASGGEGDGVEHNDAAEKLRDVVDFHERQAVVA